MMDKLEEVPPEELVHQYNNLMSEPQYENLLNSEKGTHDTDEEEAFLAEMEQLLKDGEPLESDKKHKPGDVWETDKGKWRAKNRNGGVWSFDSEEEAKDFSEAGEGGPKKVARLVRSSQMKRLWQGGFLSHEGLVN